MSENSMFEHDLEQKRAALARTLLDELELDVRDALQLVDHFYEDVAISPESGSAVERSHFGDFSRRRGPRSGS